MEYWKLKLKHILHSTQFCGICLCTDQDMNTVNYQFEIILCEKSHNTTLGDILDVVFNKTVNIASAQVCNGCIKKLIQSYIFIQQARDTSRILNSCLNDLYNKSCYIYNNILNKDQDTSNLYNVIIALDTKKIVENDDRHKTEEIAKEETKRVKMRHKRTFKCLICDVVLPSYKAWKLHAIKTHKNKLKCKICQKLFQSQTHLIRHYRLHLKSRCKICHGTIEDGGMLAHLKEYHKHLLCSICNVAFCSAEDLERHKRESHYRDDCKCLTCLKSYTEVELALHQCRFSCASCTKVPCIHHKYLMCYREQILNGVLRTKCLHCQYVCASKKMLIAHVDMCHLNQYSCDICSQTFNSELNLNTHIHNFHKKVHICCCGMEFTDRRIFQSHIKDCQHNAKTYQNAKHRPNGKTKETVRQRKEIFPCGLCNKVFSVDFVRKRHMIQAHSGQRKNRATILDCVVCQETFLTKKDLVHHMKTHGSNIKYPCRICDTQYETLRQFRAHNRKHEGPFAVCEVCGKEMRAMTLKKHMTTHTDSPVTCETCGKSFARISLLKYHQKEHLKSVPCPKCDKMINPARLRRHYKNHLIQEDPNLKDASKQPNLKCEMCEYKTWNNILLECHMNRHHLKIQPYICHICSKPFIGKHLLKKHIDTHTVAKNVMCMICMKKFANGECLKMHLRLHTGERPFTCEICGDRFRSSSILNVHKVKKHSDRNNSCPLCANKFYTVRDLRRHIIKVHWKEKGKRFDPRELKGLGEEHYYLFHDGRRVRVDEENIQF